MYAVKTSRVLVYGGPSRSLKLRHESQRQTISVQAVCYDGLNRERTVVGTDTDFGPHSAFHN